MAITHPTEQLPDVEKLVAELVAQMRSQVTPQSCFIGIHTGGVWLAERLHAELGIEASLGTIDVSFYRDDFGSRGLHKDLHRSNLPFEVEGRNIVVVDDVLYTGRTIRAALNELFDYGRPARVDLAVLVDRGGRELPITANFVATKLSLAPAQNLQLERADDGKLSLRLAEAK